MVGVGVARGGSASVHGGGSRGGTVMMVVVMVEVIVVGRCWCTRGLLQWWR